MKKVDGINYLWESVWTTQGLQLMYTISFEFITEKLHGNKKNEKI